MLILNILPIIELLEEHDLDPFDYSVEEGYACVFNFGYQIEIEVEDSRSLMVVIRHENTIRQTHILDIYEFEQFIRRRSWLAMVPAQAPQRKGRILSFPKHNS